MVCSRTEAAASLPKAFRFFLRVGVCLGVAAGATVQPARGQEAGEPEPPMLEIPVTAGLPEVPVMVELTGEPAARVYRRAIDRGLGPRRHERPGPAALAEARRAVQAHLHVLEGAQARLAADLRTRFGAREIFRVRRALNGLAVRVPAGRLAEIRRLPGVKAVHVLPLEYPASSSSVPFLGIPQLWSDGLGLGRSLTGAGVRIGIIDTGIDYQHADFGGTGQLADYQANDRTAAPDAFFPTVKVVGGYDFAGDTYTGSNLPTPDPDPMDCNGHGTHVAGTAAGFGVKTDGTTFTGPWDGSVPFASLRIGPGAAPQALLYALRVFGCTGGTNLTVQAIDWTVDPNGDGDFSDHLDVVNLSLGAAFGNPASATEAAAENAALAGVIVVASAGNSGDTFFIDGSPGSAGRAIAVAAVADSGEPGAEVVVNAPPAIAGSYAALSAAFAPAPPAPAGQTASVVLVNDGSTAGPGTTSDACQSPFLNAAAVAGNIALVDRGGPCGFINKVASAQAAGAIGVIVANNMVGDPNLVSMAGSGFTITIPSVFVSQAAGATLRSVAGVSATLASANAGDTLVSLSSRGPRDASPVLLKPDISAPGLNITSAQTGVTCTSGACQRPDPSGFLAGSPALTISGTSMASPHVAGIMALLRELHPNWTVEELKALAMNGAVHDATLGANASGAVYGPNRVGAGRVDPPSSAVSEVYAYDADPNGLVSVSFDGIVVGAVSRTKTIRVDNRGPTDATFDLSVDTALDAPGVSFSLPGGSMVTVPAGGSAELAVQMDASSWQMDHVREATVTATQPAPGVLAGLGNLARHWLTEEAGYVSFRQGGVLKLRVPLYAAARPASTMSAPPAIATGGAPSGSAAIPLSGTDVCSGTLGGGPVCTGSFPTKEVSLVTPFELQVVSPLDPALPAFADLQYAGVAYSAASNLVLFGVSTWGKWASPTDVSFNVYVDGNGDGIWDRILFNSNAGTMNAALFGGTSQAQDTFVNAVLNLATNGVSIGGGGLYVNRLSSAVFDSALFDNRVLFLAASPAQLGIVSGTRFRYKIVTCPGYAPLCAKLGGGPVYDSALGPYSWNIATASQGLNFGGANLFSDLNGASLPVNWNTANLAADGSSAALLLHHHNVDGQQAQVVPLAGAPATDLSLSKTVSPATAVTGQKVTYTITVSNLGPSAATGVVVSDPLPAGLTYVSDTGGGAYSPATGLWAVGSLGVSGSATLQVTAAANGPGGACNTAQITSRTPLDPDPANDRATACFTIARTRARADLVLTKTDGRATLTPGRRVTYTITVTNTGPDPAASALVTDTLPPELLGATWTCAAAGGATCTASGVGSIADAVSLPVDASVTFTLTATVSLAATGSLSNTATVTLPPDTADPVLGNNTATDTDAIVRPARIGDFDGDGRTDLLAWNLKAGQAQVWLMNGLVAATQPLLAGKAGDSVVGVGDYDGDGRADVLWQQPSGQAYLWPDANPKAGTLLPGPPFAGGQIVGSGDYDGDGRSDILWLDPKTGTVEVWLMNGAKVLASGSPGALPGWEVRSSGDYDGDGRSDVLWRNPATGETQIWLMGGVTRLSAGPSGTLTPLTWQVVGSGDYDGDGHSDVFWANTALAGRAQLWLMDGRAVLSQSLVFADTDTYVHSGDYDGDGRSDTMWLRRNTGRLFGSLMNGPVATYKAFVGALPAPVADWQVFSPR